MGSAAKKYRAAMGKVLGMVSVEPMLLLYVAPSVLASLAMQNLNLEKACRVNLAFNSTVCDALTRRDIGPYKQQVSLTKPTTLASLQLLRGPRRVLERSFSLSCLLAHFTVTKSEICATVIFSSSWDRIPGVSSLTP